MHVIIICLSVCLTEWGSTKTGEQDELIVTVLSSVLKVPQFLPQEQRFDIRVLVRLYIITAYYKYYIINKNTDAHL